MFPIVAVGLGLIALAFRFWVAEGDYWQNLRSERRRRQRDSKGRSR
jgi:hypothetical protein